MQHFLLSLSFFFFSSTILIGQSYDSTFHDYEIIELNSYDFLTQVKTIYNGSIILDLENHSLELVQSDIISSDYQSINSDGSSVPADLRAIPMQGYTSKGGRVSLSFAQNFIYGFIEVDEDVVFIEPASYYNSFAKADEFIFYRASDVIDDTQHTCAPIELENNIKNANSANKKMVDLCYEVEYAICNDYSMIQKYTNAAGAENHAIGVTNNVNTSYNDEFADEIRFTIQGQYNSTCAGCDPWTSSTDANVLINDFRLWTIANLTITHDIASLWTNRDFDGTTIGLAYVGGMCNSNYKVNILQDWSSNASLKRVMVSHELGHNFNSPHDASGSIHIMAPIVSNSTTWSSSSIAIIETFYTGLSCFNICTGSTPQIQFAEQASTVGESGSTGSSGPCNEPFELVELDVTMSIAPTSNITIGVAVDPSSTAVENFDFELLTNSIVFTPSSNLTQVVQIRIINDQIEELNIDDIVLNLSISAGTATLGPFSSQTISIVDSGDQVSSECCTGGAEITYGSHNYNATTVFMGTFEDGRSRTIILASELIAAGLTAGNIEQLSLNVVTKNSTGPFNDFRIGMANVANSNLSGMSWISTTEVFTDNHTTSTGWNNFNFSNSFDWDGTSNLYISFCFNNSAAVGEDIIMHTIPTVATSTQMINFQLNNGTDGCNNISTNTTYSYGTAIQPRLKLKQTGGAVVETNLNSNSVSNISAGETAHFYHNSKIIASIKNLGLTDIDCSDASIVTAGIGQENAGFGNGNYSSKTFEISGSASATYELSIYFTDEELAIWGSDKLNLSMVQSTKSLASSLVSDVVIKSARSEDEIGIGEQIAYTGFFLGPGFFAVTDIEEEIVTGKFDNADVVISEIGKGILMNSLSNNSYRLTANNENNIVIDPINGTIKASLEEGDLFFGSSSNGIILTKPDGTFAKLSIDQDGMPILQTVNLPSNKVDLVTGDFGISQAGKGLILKNVENECYRLSLDAGEILSVIVPCQ